MPLDDCKIDKLVRLADDNNHTVYAANLTFLDKEDIVEFESSNILLFRGYSDQIRCGYCHNQCAVRPKIVDCSDDVQKGVCHCTGPEQSGRLEYELDEMKYWDVNLKVLTTAEDDSDDDRKNALPLNIRVANVLIKYPNATSGEIAKIVESTNGSVRTTSAWVNRRQLRESCGAPAGWKDSAGNCDAADSAEIKAEYWDIYEMFQQYKSGDGSEYPSVQLVAERLDIDPTEAKRLLCETRSIFRESFIQD